ncbi:hypothetical protein APX80_11980 [Escherichia coli]|nr:hypothetical protein APX80_11980 [Escherichia coli]
MTNLTLDVNIIDFPSIPVAMLPHRCSPELLNYSVVDSIGQRNSYVKTWGCGGFLNETNIYSRGKSLCF